MKQGLDREAIPAGMDGWPDTWRGVPADVAAGRRLIEAMRAFAAALIDEGLAAGTLHRHLNSLWLLGGHLVAAAQHDAELRLLAGNQMLLRFVDLEGGPSSRHISTEDEQRRFDSTCRKLYRFLTAGRAA